MFAALVLWLCIVLGLTNRSDRYGGAVRFIDLCTMVMVSKSISCWTFNHFRPFSKISGSTAPYFVLVITRAALF